MGKQGQAVRRHGIKTICRFMCIAITIVTIMLIGKHFTTTPLHQSSNIATSITTEELITPREKPILWHNREHETVDVLYDAKRSAEDHANAQPDKRDGIYTMLIILQLLRR